ncbi:hypothetical protein [Pararhizobium sp. PWRC1-1]|uniref:hypothetical protein n=1 Tax=Pararhizobium sp. PWRC1-1 TaxID=2804566 RepID=UPI003CFAC6B4
MSKGRRIGKFGAGSLVPLEQIDIKNIEQDVVYHGVADPVESLIPRDFKSCDLLWNNREVIFDNIAEDRSEGTIKSYRNLLRAISAYIGHTRSNGALVPTQAGEIDTPFVVGFLMFIDREKNRAGKVRFFYRILGVIGVPASVLPPNPFDDEDPEPLSIPSVDQIRMTVKMLKADCQLVIARSNRVAALENEARDPRRVGGGKKGEWKKPQSGYFAVSRIVGIHLKPWHLMRNEAWFSTVMRGLETCPGPTVVDGSGTVSVQFGWNGHIRWFHPFHDDLIPIMSLVMVRTGFNFSSVVRLKCGEWEEPYPFNHNLRDDFCFIRGLKSRGKQDALDPPKVVRCVSSKRPWSHPYRLLKFVEELTAKLRTSINDRISELECRATTPKEQDEFLHLKKIKDDLFIYRTQSGKHAVNSLATYAGNGLADTAMRFLKRYGLSDGVRSMRNFRLSYAFEMSSHHLAFVQILAGHATGRTSLIYAKREAALDRIYKVFQEIFTLSISLINAGRYTLENVRALLEAQGLSNDGILNVTNPNYLTRWGNGCATPTNPPRGFDADTPPNHYCRHQNCIDGCPSARWFPSALAVVKNKIAELEERRSRLGLQSLLASSLDNRIRRCRDILNELERGQPHTGNP